MTTTQATANRFPESVYRHVSDEPVEYASGTTLPPFTREIVERIAETKPDWAEFDDGDINGDPLTRDHGLTEVTWCRAFGDVDVLQDATYNIATGEKVDEGELYIHSWTEKFTDADATFAHAANLEDAATLMRKISGDPLV